MQRQQQLEANPEDEGLQQDEARLKALFNRFEVQLIPMTKGDISSIRKIKAAQVGHLVRIKGMVTRVSDVKPMMTVATYTCDLCGFETYQQVTGRQFTPVGTCSSPPCMTNRSNGRLVLQTKASKFVRYQQVKMQELPGQVPMGHIPRTLNLVLRGQLTRTCSPGALVTISGMFLPLPTTAQQQVWAGLITETYLEAMHVENHKERYQDMKVSEELERSVRNLQSEHGSEMYQVLSQSIAPEIFGHEDIKKALLLLMVGGVTKKMDEGMRIRGDINMCLMGDPGVAKSQLLKHIATVAPRAVYTTGKGSSGVGLTAAVLRDPITKEMTLEGGALVLADMGICCIDEFDKMEESDRTAIHEVMEQQTVSIAKAGITTTLNARTCVLAAANPLYGRYNRKMSPSENIDLPNALLSRFDLMFLILDEANASMDEQLARHIAFVHQHGRQPEMDFTPVAPKVLRYYVAIAKQFEPVIPPTLSNYIVEAYVTLRQEDSCTEQTAMTARQLLSILRLAQAMGRLRFAEVVQQSDVDEAMRLVYISKASLLEPQEVMHRHQDTTSKIYRLLIDHKDAHGGIEYSVIEPIVLRKGYTSVQLKATIDTYAGMDVLHWNRNKTRIDCVLP